MSYLRSGLGTEFFLPDVTYVTDGGLVLVRPEALPALQQVLALMTFDLKSEQDPVQGEARMPLGPPPKSAWAVIDDFIVGGHMAALVEKRTIPSDTAKLIFTAQPQLVASLASEGSTHALIRPEPAELVAQAKTLIGQGKAGPIPGGPNAPPPPVVAASSGVPAWMWLAGAGVLLAVAALGSGGGRR
jgi:hypothetical protein